MNIHIVKLTGVHDFWVETPIENIKPFVDSFERERGKYGYPKLSVQKKLIVVKAFIESCNVSLKYSTVYEKQLRVSGRSATWLHNRLNEEGHKCTYITVTRWLKAENKLNKEIKPLIKKLLHVD